MGGVEEGRSGSAGVEGGAGCSGTRDASSDIEADSDAFAAFRADFGFTPFGRASSARARRTRWARSFALLALGRSLVTAVAAPA
jgi:hypothetical protein